MASSCSSFGLLYSYPNPRFSSSICHKSSQALTFSGPSLSLRLSFSRRSGFVVRAWLPLVGNLAPDFKSGAAFHQEFVKVKLSEYIGRKYVILLSHHHFPPKQHLLLSRPKTIRFLPPPSSSSSSKTSLLSLPIPPKPSPPPPPPIPSTDSTTELQEKILYLDSLGIDSIPLLTAHPPFLSTSLSHLKATLSYLSSTIPLSRQDIRRLVSLCPEVLTLPLPSIIASITFLLREAHVCSRDLRHVIHGRPRLLVSDVKTRLRPTLYFLQGTIGISEISSHTRLLSCSVEEKFLPRIEYFHENIGTPYEDTILMFRRFPSLFCYSIKDNLEPKFNYFVVEMGRDLKELIDFPHYFSFSLENRIKPRHQQCVEMGVCLPLSTMLKLNEKRFQDRLEVHSSSSLPVRTSAYWNCRQYEGKTNVS